MIKQFEGVLGYFLGLSYVVISLVIILAIAEGIIHEPFINRYVWAGISMGLFAFCIPWLVIFYLRSLKESKRGQKDATSLFYRYGLYVFGCAINSVIFCAVIIPVAFAKNGITDDRVKDYVLIYPMISSLTIVSGVYVGFKTSHINLDSIFI